MVFNNSFIVGIDLDLIRIYSSASSSFGRGFNESSGTGSPFGNTLTTMGPCMYWLPVEVYCSTLLEASSWDPNWLSLSVRKIIIKIRIEISGTLINTGKVCKHLNYILQYPVKYDIKISVKVNKYWIDMFYRQFIKFKNAINIAAYRIWQLYNYTNIVSLDFYNSVTNFRLSGKI